MTRTVLRWRGIARAGKGKKLVFGVIIGTGCGGGTCTTASCSPAGRPSRRVGAHEVNRCNAGRCMHCGPVASRYIMSPTRPADGLPAGKHDAVVHEPPPQPVPMITPKTSFLPLPAPSNASANRKQFASFCISILRPRSFSRSPSPAGRSCKPCWNFFRSPVRGEIAPACRCQTWSGWPGSWQPVRHG